MARGAALALILALGVSARAEQPAKILAPAADIALGRDIFTQLIEIDSTHAKGSTEAAHALEARRPRRSIRPSAARSAP